MHKFPKGIAEAQLLDAIWCPICGCKLSVEEVDGKRKLKCSKHGEMKWYLEQDPLAAAAVAEHCDAVGVVNLEAE